METKVATLTANCVDNTQHNAAEETVLSFTHKALKFCKEYMAQAIAVILYLLLGPTQSLTACCNLNTRDRV
jgi:hypothetical protein